MKIWIRHVIRGKLILMIVIRASPDWLRAVTNPALLRRRCYWNNKSWMRGVCTSPSDLIAVRVFLLGWCLCRLSISSGSILRLIQTFTEGSYYSVLADLLVPTGWFSVRRLDLYLPRAVPCYRALLLESLKFRAILHASLCCCFCSFRISSRH